MNREEAASVMNLLSSAYPRTQLAPATVDIWYRTALERCDVDLAKKVALDLIARPDHKGEFPSPAQFNELKRQALLVQAAREPLPAPEEFPKLPDDEAQRMFDDMRIKLGKAPKHRSEP